MDSEQITSNIRYRMVADCGSTLSRRQQTCGEVVTRRDSSHHKAYAALHAWRLLVKARHRVSAGPTQWAIRVFCSNRKALNLRGAFALRRIARSNIPQSLQPNLRALCSARRGVATKNKTKPY